MASPFDVFRKPLPARVFGPRILQNGVMVPGAVIDTSLSCSVQRIGRTEGQQLTDRGKRVSDYRRLYSEQRLPTSEEKVLGVAAAVPAESDLLDPAGQVISIGPGESEPGQVQIDGLWYMVAERHPMQNGIINHYQYLVVRVTRNDQTV